jgi:hypothetical protein
MDSSSDISDGVCIVYQGDKGREKASKIGFEKKENDVHESNIGRPDIHASKLVKSLVVYNSYKPAKTDNIKTTPWKCTSGDNINAMHQRTSPRTFWSVRIYITTPAFEPSSPTPQLKIPSQKIPMV